MTTYLKIWDFKLEINYISIYLKYDFKNKCFLLGDSIFFLNNQELPIEKSNEQFTIFFNNYEYPILKENISGKIIKPFLFLSKPLLTKENIKILNKNNLITEVFDDTQTVSSLDDSIDSSNWIPMPTYATILKKGLKKN